MKNWGLLVLQDNEKVFMRYGNLALEIACLRVLLQMVRTPMVHTIGEVSTIWGKVISRRKTRRMYLRLTTIFAYKIWNRQLHAIQGSKSSSLIYSHKSGLSFVYFFPQHIYLSSFFFRYLIILKAVKLLGEKISK